MRAFGGRAQGRHAVLQRGVPAAGDGRRRDQGEVVQAAACCRHQEVAEAAAADARLAPATPARRHRCGRSRCGHAATAAADESSATHLGSRGIENEPERAAAAAKPLGVGVWQMRHVTVAERRAAPLRTRAKHALCDVNSSYIADFVLLYYTFYETFIEI